MGVEGNNVARRTLAKGAAWSIPVIATAVAAPAASASTAGCAFGPSGGPILGQSNCLVADPGGVIMVNSSNVPAFGVSFLAAACIGHASWTVVYPTSLTLALSNFGSPSGASIDTFNQDGVTGTLTAAGALIPALNPGVIAYAGSSTATIMLSVADSSGTTRTTSMTFTGLRAWPAQGIPLSYTGCAAP